MTTKHTPAPWRYETSTKTIRAVPSNHWLASMDSWDGAVDHKANATLIAAAPDLLEALQRYMSEMEIGDAGQRDIESFERMAKAAIAKATGATGATA